MSKPRTIGNMIAPPRFLAFLAALIIAFPLASHALHRWALGAMTAFDVAASLFLISCIPLLGTREARTIREHAVANDANRRVLLIVSAIVIAALFTAIAAEAVGHNPQPLTKALIIGTLALAWLFSNSIYALHYAHLYYSDDGGVDSGGIEIKGCAEPDYWDFAYFSFTLGMTFQTSDVDITSRQIRRVALGQCLAAFVFNLGVLAFTINTLGSAGN